MAALKRFGSACLRVVLICVCILLLLMLLTTVGAPILQFIWHLSSGWIRHSATNLPHLQWDIVTLLLSLTATVATIFLLHRFLSSRYSIRQSASICMIFLSISAGAVAMTGIVHELVWLARSPVTENRGRASNRTMALSNGKQCMLALFELADEGIYPLTIEELASHLPTHSGIWTFQPARGSAREAFVLLRPGEDLLTLPPETPFLAAFGIGEKSIIFRADGSGETVPTANIDQQLSPQR